MKVQFKGSAQSYVCSEPVEQKLFKAGVTAGWAMMFHIKADVNSSVVDEVITPDGISEITFTNDAGTTQTISGYNAISACTIRHRDAETDVELQVTKMNGGVAGGEI